MEERIPRTNPPRVAPPRTEHFVTSSLSSGHSTEKRTGNTSARMVPIPIPPIYITPIDTAPITVAMAIKTTSIRSLFVKAPFPPFGGFKLILFYHYLIQQLGLIFSNSKKKCREGKGGQSHPPQRDTPRHDNLVESYKTNKYNGFKAGIKMKQLCRTA